MSPTDTPPPESGPTRTRTRDTWFGNAPATMWTFLGRWAFPLFVLLIAIIGHSVLLPFVFAGLIAYILSPIVRAMAERPNGTRRMPRGLAVIICYIVFIAGVVGFMFLLVPRLSRDVARLGKEAPGVYKRINEEYTPELARWLEAGISSLQASKRARPEERALIVPDVLLPPGTAFTADAAARTAAASRCSSRRTASTSRRSPTAFTCKPSTNAPSRARARPSCAST